MTKIASVGEGWYVCGELLSYYSQRSLLDFDIVLFVTPGIQHEPARHHPMMTHWAVEIAEALNHGKSVFVICKTPAAYRTTSTAPQQSGHQFVPSDTVFVPRLGTETIPGAQNGELADIFNTFVKYVSYEVTIQGKLDATFLQTKTGGYVVAGRRRFESGNMILLPNLQLTKLFEKHKGVEREPAIAQTRLEFEAFLRAYHDRISKSGKAAPPSWLKAEEWRPKFAAELSNKISTLRKDLAQREAELQETLQEQNRHDRFIDLIFESGPVLEKRVIEALREIGFSAERFAKGDIEIDVIFEADGRRFIGEVEGKASKPVGTDKMNQLLRNVNDDFSRDEILEPAKAVLFGNANRSVPPKERTEHFTDKVRITASRSGAALVRTPDLLQAVNAILDGADDSYKSACRAAIWTTVGEVVFPEWKPAQ